MLGAQRNCFVVTVDAFVHAEDLFVEMQIPYQMYDARLGTHWAGLDALAVTKEILIVGLN